MPKLTQTAHVACNAKMPLHNYQRQHINQVLTGFNTYRSIMLQMPTGAGKTHVFCEVAKTVYEKRKGRILILAHRTELIYQIKDRIRHFGLTAGIIKSGHVQEEDRQIQIASVQTLRRRNHRLAFLQNVALIIVDEAHHTPSETYVELLNVYQQEQTKLLGVTATPVRLDGKGFDTIFDYLICSYPFKWFIQNSYLAPIKHFASDVIKLDNISIVKSREGYDDYKEEETVRYYMDKTIMADLIKSYEKFGNNKKAVVFAVSIKHAEAISLRYNEAGYKSAVISSETSAPDREKMVDAFKKNQLQILVNVDIFSEGFDCPDIEVVQIARPTKSLVKYLQMAGRVTRIFKDKEYGIVLDNSCLWQDHGLVTDEREWVLNGCTTKQIDFENLFFSDGTSGSEAYERKLKELSHVQIIEVGETVKPDEIIFTNKRLEVVRKEYKVLFPDLKEYLQEINFDLDKHLKGTSIYPDKRIVSTKLYELIDWKFGTNRALDDIIW